MIKYLFIILLTACTSQQPTSTVVNYYITQTDNSQTIQGENIQATSKPTVTAKPTSEIKTAMTTENTSKNEMWIYWTLLTGVVGFVLWRKFARS